MSSTGSPPDRSCPAGDVSSRADRAWFIRRGLLALGLAVGFYALALGIACLLIAFPILSWRAGIHIYGYFPLFCFAGGAIIFFAILPRPDVFRPPGPRLTREAQPRLFAVLDEAARATGEAPPREVYLSLNPNAGVTVRGGIAGIGSRRVMELGLMLLQALSVTQFRAVLVHEFGHYAAGDTLLGRWIVTTRAAIIRTIGPFGSPGGSRSSTDTARA